MGTIFQELRTGCLSRVMENEPMFVLLARDPHAPALVRAWCEQREAEIAAGKRPASDMEQVQEARDCARRMMLWREEHNGEWRRDRLPLDDDSTVKVLTDTRPATLPELRRCNAMSEHGDFCTRDAGHDGPCEAVPV